MGKPPYDDPDTLDLMRSDADEVELVPVSSLAGEPDERRLPTDAGGFEVPSDAVALGELHFHLE